MGTHGDNTTPSKQAHRAVVAGLARGVWARLGWCDVDGIDGSGFWKPGLERLGSERLEQADRGREQQSELGQVDPGVYNVVAHPLITRELHVENELSGQLTSTKA